MALKRVCEFCKVEFEVNSKKPAQKFCSRSCMGKWRSANMSGPNSPGWKGIDNHYGTAPWKRARNAARARDNNTCQKCGATDVFLEVHHIVEKENFATREEADQLSNLRTVCRRCHAKEHPRNEAQKLGLLAGQKRDRSNETFIPTQKQLDALAYGRIKRGCRKGIPWSEERRAAQKEKKDNDKEETKKYLEFVKGQEKEI